MGASSFLERPLSSADIRESHTQFHGAWSQFARSCPDGEVLATPEVLIASANVLWPVANAAFLPAPVETEAALERTVAAAARYFASRPNGWMFILGEDWLTPPLRARAPELLGAHGLKWAMDSVGMVAERLAPPARPPPALEVRLVTDEEGKRHIADINALSYEVPLEVARPSVVHPDMFQGDCRGYVGFARGQAVSVVAIVRVKDIAYVAYVATHPEHRQRGYAEAVIRHGLADAKRVWVLEKTVLHASMAGHPLYRSMGYRDVTRFGFYLTGPSEH